ncbi:hypothetical protein [Deinococcus sonorensis]|uniref:Uncharacterized protein n=2 Tax=Deinococcus sonorensis TaxID=309891 RepID=A0AAU7U7Q7_9DEIO
MNTRRWFLTTVLALGGAPVLAVLPGLTAQQLQEAYQGGVKLAKDPEGGYPLLPYTLYHTQDSLLLEPANGDVDAVVVGTPFDRTRYQSFLAASGDETLTPAQARERARLPDGWVSVLIFAHGSKPADQEFLNGFTGVRLVLPGRTLLPGQVQKSGTDLSQYPHTPGEIGERFVGTVTYLFHPSAAELRGSATLNFNDPTGKSFTLPIQFSRYR